MVISSFFSSDVYNLCLQFGFVWFWWRHMLGKAYRWKGSLMFQAKLCQFGNCASIFSKSISSRWWKAVIAEIYPLKCLCFLLVLSHLVTSLWTVTLFCCIFSTVGCYTGTFWFYLSLWLLSCHEKLMHTFSVCEFCFLFYFKISVFNGVRTYKLFYLQHFTVWWACWKFQFQVVISFLILLNCEEKGIYWDLVS